MSATNKTPNYDLSQWIGEDMITHEDVNADNLKIDEGIKSAADGVAALAQSLTADGYLRVKYGFYTGTGLYGSSNQMTLSFEKEPLFIFVFPVLNGIGSYHTWLGMVWDKTFMPRVGTGTGSTAYLHANYYDGYMQFYSPNTAAAQMNENGVDYAYIALIPA